MVSVPVVGAGSYDTVGALTSLVGRSLYKSESWRESLVSSAKRAGVDVERAVAETDAHDEAEGLYIKWEDDEEVLGRYKWVRASFLAAVLDSGSHWHARPIVENTLADDVDIFAP